MIQRALLFRNLIDNIPKNIGLYSVGVMLLFLYRVPTEVHQTLLGLLAFLVSYSSIYVLNDLFDVEEDKVDEKKILRKPIAQGAVNKNEAVKIFFGIICSLVLINILYSFPLVRSKKEAVISPDLKENLSIEGEYPTSLKHTILRPPLVLIMQLLKIFLPWTLSTEVMQFPTLFALGFSLIYYVLFKGYKENRTVGASVKHEPLLFGTAIVVFVLSMSMYPEPILQSSILIYLLLGILFFRNSHLTDKKVLMLSPIYIFLGVVILFYLITNI